MRNALRTIAIAVGILNLSVLGANTKQQLSLTVELKGQNPNLTVCTLVRPAEPFQFVWTNAEVTTVISGEIRHRTKRGFPVDVAIMRGHGEGWSADRLLYELKLGVGAKSPVAITMSNHPSPILAPQITLADGPCRLPGEPQPD